MTEQRRLHVDAFWAAQGLDAIERAIVGDLAGVRGPETAAVGGDVQADLFFLYGTPRPRALELTASTRRAFAEFVAAHGVEALLEHDDPEVLGAPWEGTTAAGHLVRTNADVLIAALRAGKKVPVGIHELALAIKAGVDRAVFMELADASADDLATVWWNGVTLAKVAAIHGRPNILRALLERGVTFGEARWETGSGEESLSVLDHLASLAAPPERMADVAAQIIALGEQPYLPSTLTTLQAWLPDTPAVALHPRAAFAMQTSRIAEAARNLAALHREWTAKIENAAGVEQRCGEVLLAQSGTAHGTVDSSSLSAKTRHETLFDLRNQRLWEQLEQQAALEPGAEVPDDLASVSEQLIDLLTAARWEDTLELVDGSQFSREAYSTLVTIALGSSSAPPDVVLALVQRSGEALPSDAVLSVAGNSRSDREALVRNLEAFGMDLRHVDAEGRNALSVLAGRNVAEPGALALGAYLLERGVAVKPEGSGFDPLDILLKKLVDYPVFPIDAEQRARLARMLIDNGAPIEASHLELASALARANERVYQQLLAAVPELRAG